MAAGLVLGPGDDPCVRLTSDGDVVEVHRARTRGGRALFFFVILALWSIPTLGGVGACVAMAWTAVADRDAVALFGAAVFGLMSIPCIAGWLYIQGFLFPQKVTIGLGTYQFVNGALRFSRKFAITEATLCLYPSYSRGDWGCCGWIKIGEKGRPWWPFILSGIRGTKYDALSEARAICEWVRGNTRMGGIALLKWGDTADVRPGEDTIR